MLSAETARGHGDLSAFVQVRNRPSEIPNGSNNLSKPCRKVSGIKPKDFRDRFATQLRGYDFNQVNIETLMGHSEVDTNSSYGYKNWDDYVGLVNRSNECVCVFCSKITFSIGRKRM